MAERKSSTRKSAEKKAEPPASDETPAAPATYTASMDDLKAAAAEQVTEPKKGKGD